VHRAGTDARIRKRKVVTVKSWDDLLEQLKAFHDSIQHPERATPLPGDDWQDDESFRLAHVRAALDKCRKRQIMSEYVPLTPDGRPYAESTIKRYFKTAKAIAGITRRFRFHDQRHTFASTLASKCISFTHGCARTQAEKS
jgi:integrase